MYIQCHGYNTLKNHWKNNSFAQAVQQSVLSSAWVRPGSKTSVSPSCLEGTVAKQEGLHERAWPCWPCEPSWTQHLHGCSCFSPCFTGKFEEPGRLGQSRLDPTQNSYETRQEVIGNTPGQTRLHRLPHHPDSPLRGCTFWLQLEVPGKARAWALHPRGFGWWAGGNLIGGFMEETNTLHETTGHFFTAFHAINHNIPTCGLSHESHLRSKNLAFAVPRSCASDSWSPSTFLTVDEHQWFFVKVACSYRLTLHPWANFGVFGPSSTDMLLRRSDFKS